MVTSLQDFFLRLQKAGYVVGCYDQRVIVFIGTVAGIVLPITLCLSTHFLQLLPSLPQHFQHRQVFILC